MTTLIQLPDNHTALLRDSNELSNKDVKVIRRAARIVGILSQKLTDLGMDEIRDKLATEAADKDAENAKALTILTQLSDDEDDATDLVQRTCAYIRLIEWSLDLPKPSTAEDIDLLPRPIYEALTKEAAKIDLSDTFDKNLETMSDLKADTENSSSSEEPLAEVSS